MQQIAGEAFSQIFSLDIVQKKNLDLATPIMHMKNSHNRQIFSAEPEPPPLASISGCVGGFKQIVGD